MAVFSKGMSNGYPMAAIMEMAIRRMAEQEKVE
jgi:hypothetical protein